MQFTELDLRADLLRGIADLGFTRCTDVQSQTLTHTLQGRDVAVQSQTGTGKTAAFLVTIFQLLNEHEKYRGSRALIIAPTRELAVQIENDAKAIGKHMPQRTGCFYGGVGYGPQERLLADKVEIVIGTPGRILDFNQSGKLDFHEMGVLVIDEADRLFDMGFYPDIRKLMRRSRPREERLTMLYSATLSTNVRNLAWQYMNDPAEVEIAPEQMTVETVRQELYHVSLEEKFRLLLGVLEKYRPHTALVFCNTKRATEIVAKKLELNGYPCEFIIGDLPQKKRLHIIDSMKSGDLRMLCATDVAARGLHVESLDLVVNYDIPEDPEAYVHRIGRTARAGKEGLAVALACERFVYGLPAIEELIGMQIPAVRVTDDLLAEDQSIGRHVTSTHYVDRPPRKRTGERYGGARRTGRGTPAPAGHRDAAGGRSDPAPRSPRREPGERRDAARAGGPTHPAGPRRPAAESPAVPHLRQRREAAVSGERSPSRDSPVDERMDFYRRKYGESFAGGGAGSPGGKPGRPEGADAGRRSQPASGGATRGHEGSERVRQAPQPKAAPAPAQPEEKKRPGLLRRIGALFGRGSEQR